MTLNIMSQALIKLANLNEIPGGMYYSALVRNMDISFSEEIPTAGVRVTDRVELIINKGFWLGLDTQSQVNILIHECGHVIFDHISRYKTLADSDESAKHNQDLLNVAADLAINQMIKGIDALKTNEGKDHEMKAITLDRVRTQFPQMEADKTMEYYYSYFKQNAKKSPQGSPVDSHEMWGEGEDKSSGKQPDPEYVKEVCKQTVKRALTDYQSMNAGSLPGNLELALDKLLNKTRDWRGDLRAFAANAQDIDIEYVRSKRNRRYGLLQPGKRRNPRLKLSVPIDVSGSVSDAELTQFFSEIDRLHKQGANVTIIEFDTQVTQTYEYVPGKRINILGRGGTHFAPAFEKAMEFDPDGIICFTDGGDCGTDCKRPKVPVLWALSPGGENSLPYNWGKKIKVELRG